MVSTLRCAAPLLLIALGASLFAGEFDPWKQAACYELEYRVDLTRWAGAQVGSVRVWLATPADNDHQKVRSLTIDSPWEYRITRDDRGNRLLYLEPGGKDIATGKVSLRCVVERQPYSRIPEASADSGKPQDRQRYLGAQRRILLDGKIRELAEQAQHGKTTDLEKIRANYDHVTPTMRYSKDGEGWGRGDTVWACDSHYGNCTDFHSVFIGMCRCQGIPARFVIGFPIPADKFEGEIGGYHCWAEAYDRQRGWLPVDASEAWKAKRFDDYFGKLPSDRVEFTVGRDLVLAPRQAGEPLNFFIYPYVEVDGEPAGDVPWQLTVRRVSVGKADG